MLLLFYVLVFWLQGMWDLSSPTWDCTCTRCTERQSLNHWTAREVLHPPVIVSTSTVLDFHQFLFPRIGYAGYLTIWISLYPASCYTIISWVFFFFFFFFCLSLNFDSLSLKCALFSLTLNDGGLVALTSPQFKSKCWVLTSHHFLNFRLISLILCQIASPVTPDTAHLNRIS